MLTLTNLSSNVYSLNYSPPMGERDLIDELVDEWRLERPDIDDDAYDAMGTIGRLARIARVLGPLIEQVFTGLGLGRGEFEVLATLRRQGEPFTMTPTAIARLVLLSPGAMTNRLDRLESAGYLERAHDPDNRRSVLVTLTPAGRELADKAMDAHATNELQLLASLGTAERRRLDTALRRMLDALAD